MTLGKRIANLRTEKKLTQEELAKIIGISRGSLSMYEIDKREPDMATLKKIADFFDISVDYLLGLTDIRNPHDNKETTIAAHRTTSLDEDLPEEARKAIEEFRQYIREKYGKKNTK